VFSNVWNSSQGLGQQIHEWTSFMAVDQFCIRVCKPGPNAPGWCQHIYDLQGCAWNEPGDYSDGFTSCLGDSGTPPGVYTNPDGSTTTWQQGDGAAPPAHPAPASSSCTTYQSAALYAATPVSSSTTTHAPSPTGSNTHTGTATQTASTTPSAALRSVNFGFGPLACLTALVGAILGSLVVLA